MSEHAGRTPQLLVSVRDAEELLLARLGGADWIDLKEPSDGPLAPVSQRAAREVSRQLAGDRNLSAALGELREWEDSPAVELLEVSGIHLVKLGLAGCAELRDWRERWLAASQRVSGRRKQLVLVAYADWERATAPSLEEVLDFARDAGSKYLLIDTFGKDGRSTLDFVSREELGETLCAASALGMTTVLAGSMTRELITEIPHGVVDICPVRGAVCHGDRADSIDAKLVADFRLALASKADHSSEAAFQPA